jgi:hypothetical protein
VTRTVVFEWGISCSRFPSEIGAGASTKLGLVRPDGGGGTIVPVRLVMRIEPSRGRAGMGVEQSGDGHEVE